VAHTARPVHGPCGLVDDGDRRHLALPEPSLLFDDFSRTLATTWTAYVLDPAETRPANWFVDAGPLHQDVPIAGGHAGDGSPDKPGTVNVAASVGAADVAVETLTDWSEGAVGIVFRWQGVRGVPSGSTHGTVVGVAHRLAGGSIR
jgi:hypothetical protein